MVTTRRELVFTLDDQATDRYPRIPFAVPVGVGSLEVGIAVQGLGGPAVVDLGCEGALGWRGWSGGARRDYVITADAATSGYLAGEPEPGEWAVVLGLHQLPADGVRIEVTIDLPARREPSAEPLAPVTPGPPRGSSRDLPADPGLRWYAGDLHAHTLHSDGSLSIDQLAARAVASGLDFLAVTDHNTISHHQLLPAHGARHGVTLLPGQEITTARGHANAFGPVGWVDFRRPTAEWFDHVARAGGLLSVNHPLADDCAWEQPGDPTARFAPPAVELWHITWYADLTATAPWAYLAQLGGAPVLLGGSDFHRPEPRRTVGTPTTWVAAEDDSAEAILAGLRAGRTAISIGVDALDRAPSTRPDPQRAPVLLRVGDALLADRADGSVLVDAWGRRRRIRGVRVTIDRWGDGPYRLEDTARRVLAVVR